MKFSTPICPYCGQSSKDWKHVRIHAASCDKNDNTYYIDASYGPIHFTDIQTDINTIRKKFPNGNVNIEGLIGFFKSRGLI